LYKEINYITTEKMPKPSECETDVDVASFNKWSSVATKRSYNKNKARNSDIFQTTQPMESANRYTLPYLPETTTFHDGNVAPKITKVTQISTNSTKERSRKNQESINYSSPKECPPTTSTKPS
jgi:hypothetical protein